MSQLKTQVILFLLIASSFSLSGCIFYKLATTQMEDPTVTYKSVDLSEIDDKKVLLNFQFDAFNPNEIGLKNVFVNYELFVEGKRLMKGKEIAVHLAPQGTTQLTVPASITYSNLLKSLGNVATRILTNEYSVPVTVKAVVFGRPTFYDKNEKGSLFSFKIDLEKTEQVKLPEKEIKKAKKRMSDELKNLLGAYSSDPRFS